jgi:hypothetical protein
MVISRMGNIYQAMQNPWVTNNFTFAMLNHLLGRTWSMHLETWKPIFYWVRTGSIFVLRDALEDHDSLYDFGEYDHGE